MTWDIFISHASEDKSQIAEPLATMFVQHGLKVWFDRFTLSIGDSLRRSIDQGLSESRYGLVILSESFFKKEWTKKELDGLLARDDGQEKRILPIWHNVSHEQVVNFSPILADKLAVSTEDGLNTVVEAVIRAIDLEQRTNIGERTAKRVDVVPERRGANLGSDEAIGRTATSDALSAVDDDSTSRSSNHSISDTHLIWIDWKNLGICVGRDTLIRAETRHRELLIALDRLLSAKGKIVPYHEFIGLDKPYEQLGNAERRAVVQNAHKKKQRIEFFLVELEDRLEIISEPGVGYRLLTY